MTHTSFAVTQGADLEQWQQAGLAAPGGTGPIVRWASEDSQHMRAHWHHEQPSPEPSRRWQRAQTAEAAFWKSWRQNVLYAHISLEAFWEEILEKTGGPLARGKILDIGCGPVSVLNFHRHPEALAIGLDPLAGVYTAEGIVEAKESLSPIPMIELTAEALPFTDASLDQLICFNVLDHVANAPAVLREMVRVLKPGGSARLYVHTFQSWIKRWLFFDRPHVYHWDHEEFQTLLREAGFQIDHAFLEPKTFDFKPGLWPKIRHFPYWVATKVGFTSYFKVQKPLTSS